MTYKEIINRFRTITDNHLMLQDFGYGDLSDLKYVSQLGTEEERVSYPYLYLLPSSSNRNGPVMNYSFNMIVMDMARTEDGADTDKYDNYITIQSQCQQYIDDVLAQLYYFYKDQPEIALTGITYTPFKEKYQDVVAGMTATISIAVPTPLNQCIAPFNNWVLDTESPIITGQRPYNSASAGTRAVAATFAIPETRARYKIEVDVDFKALYDLAEIEAPAPYNTPRLVIQQDTDTPRYIREIEFKGNDRGVQNIKTTFEIELEDITPDDNDLSFSWGYSTANEYDGTDVYPVMNLNAIEAIAGSVKIYRLDTGGPQPGEVYLEVEAPAVQTQLWANSVIPWSIINRDLYNQWYNGKDGAGNIIESYYKQERFPTLSSTLEFSVDLVLTQAWPPAANWNDWKVYWNPQQAIYTGWQEIAVTGWPASPPTIGIPFTLTFNGPLPNTESYGSIGFGVNGGYDAGIVNYLAVKPNVSNVMKFTAL